MTYVANFLIFILFALVCLWRINSDECSCIVSCPIFFAAPLVDYAAVNSAYSQATEHETFSSGRVTTMNPGTHTVAFNMYSLSGTAGGVFSGGGMQGFYIPRDLAVAQTFFCESAGSNTVNTTVGAICSVTINLPYHAAVWAQFTSSIKAPTGNYWVIASIDFDGDAVSLLQAFVDPSSGNPNLLALGPALTYAQVFHNFGQGRAAILNAGMHTISLQIRAAVNYGTIATVSMDGFFLPN